MDSDIQIAPCGTMLFYESGYTAEYVQKIIRERNLKGLRILYSFGEKPDSLDFLKEYTFLEALGITIWNKIYDLSFMFRLNNLKELKLSVDGKCRIDVSHNTQLRFLCLDWYKGRVSGLDQCTMLRSVVLVSYKEPNFKPIESLYNLKKLMVKTGSMKNLDGLEGCRSLEILSLAGCRYLTDISKLSELPSLKSLHLDSCSQVHDFSVLSKLPNLERLWIEDTRNIESISFLRDMPQLKEFCVMGNCSITDGDLSPALNTLAQITPKKHYNMEILPPDWRQKGGSSYGWWIDPIDLGD